MKNENMDRLLKRALNRTETVDPALVEKLKSEFIKEETVMTKPSVKRSFSIAAAVAMSFVFMTTVFAAWYFLSPSEVANKMDAPVLAGAFQSNDALLINETKSQNGYDVSLLGIVSGNGLTGLDETVDTEKTYAVVAIAKKEGVMPDFLDEEYDEMPFFVSPLINGQTPWRYNIASMNGGYSAILFDGVMYRLIECDSLEMFADRGLTLIVSSTNFYDNNAYIYDETTGLVKPNPTYDGINLIFDLPLSTANADYEKAQKYLDTLWEDKDTPETEAGAIAAEAESEIGIMQTDTQGLILEQVMTYDTFKAWSDNQLKEIQKMVDRGEYTQANMELDRQDFEQNLKDIENGATVTVYLYEDGSRHIMTDYPDSGFNADVDVSGGAIEITLTD